MLYEKFENTCFELVSFIDRTKTKLTMSTLQNMFYFYFIIFLNLILLKGICGHNIFD